MRSSRELKKLAIADCPSPIFRRRRRRVGAKPDRREDEGVPLGEAGLVCQVAFVEWTDGGQASTLHVRWDAR